MDANTIIQLISSLGFPIIMCGAMAYYVKYTHDQHVKERVSIAEAHKQEMSAITEALNNNTVAITRLCEKMED